MRISFIIAHPSRIFRQGIQAVLAASGDLHLVGEADCGRQALELVQQLSPRVALIDAALEDPDCVSTTQSIVRKTPFTRVIVLSVNGDHGGASQVLQAGASGILRRNCETEELIQAAREVNAGRISLSPGIAQSVVEQYVRSSGTRSASTLTARQREVLRLMAGGKNSRQIAIELSISPKTVDSHRLELMEKLQIFNVAGLTKYAVLEGLLPLEV